MGPGQAMMVVVSDDREQLRTTFRAPGRAASDPPRAAASDSADTKES
jgi:hypothetical protein